MKSAVPVLRLTEQEYVLVYRKAENVGWWEEALVPDDVVELESVDLGLKLKDIYEGAQLLTARI